MANTDIDIYGRLVNRTTDGVIAGADQLIDENLNMMQEDINRRHSEDITELGKAVWPLTVSIDATPKLVEVKVATDVNIGWNVTRNGVDVHADTEMKLNGSTTTDTATTENINAVAPQEYQYTIAAAYRGMTATATTKVKTVRPSFFGVVDKNWAPTEARVKALTKSIQEGRASTHNGINIADGLIAYCIPSEFGALTSIKDGNDYEILASYHMQSVNFADGSVYNCYILSIPVTASGVTQIYK